MPWFYVDNLQELQWFVKAKTKKKEKKEEKNYGVTSDQGKPTFQFFGQFVGSIRLLRFLLSDLFDGLAKPVEFCILLCQHKKIRQKNNTATYCKAHYVKKNTRFQLGCILQLLALPVELFSFTIEFYVLLAQLLGHLLKFLGCNCQLLGCPFQLL